MSKWTIDPDHSVGAFSIRHLLIAYVHGQFNKLSGTVHYVPEDLSRTLIELEIDVSSIITGINKRDIHLKSSDFFDTEKYPVITFKSTRAEITGFNTCRVSGILAVHGTERPLTMEVNIAGPVKSPFGETCIGISGRAVLNREEFGLTWNKPMENGGPMVGRDVEISMDIEADLISA
ncbi:MAG: YceI family protein [Nitrospirota bacterium]|nr:YceI family protein [Nitrospirota bacterium]